MFSRCTCLLMSVLLLIGLTACGRKAEQACLAGLESENIMVRVRAIEEAGWERYARATPRLCELCAPGHSDQVRVASLRALARIRVPEAAPAVIAQIADLDEAVALAAIEAAGALRDPRAAEPLMACMGRTNVDLAALWALGRLRDPRAVPALSAYLTNDDVYVRYNAAQALKRIGGVY